jgi:hypothetical protein
MGNEKTKKCNKKASRKMDMISNKLVGPWMAT